MEKKEKLAFFLGDLAVGGVERVLLTYANELVKRGYPVSFVVAKGGGGLESELSQRVKLIKFEEPRVRKSWKKLWYYVHHEKPDYILTGGDAANIMVIVASLFTNTRVIISQHNYNDIEASNQGFWSRYLHKIMHFFYPKAYRIIAVSEGISNYLIKDVGIKKERIKVLYNPIDIASLRIRSAEKPSVIVPEKYILFVGRISPVKNLPLLLNAYEQSCLKDVSLVIVGDGEELVNLKNLANSLNKRASIIFTGQSCNPIPYIANCKALVLCSFSEAMPVVLLEAMAFDKPIVATPTLGAKEVLAGRKGTFMSKSFDDVDEFAALLEEGVKYGKSGLSYYTKQYDIESIVDQLCGYLV